MIKRLTLTKEHLILASLIRFEDDEENNRYFIDKYDPYYLSGRLEDIALALGMMDKAIPGTQFDPEGAAFPDDVEKFLLDTHHFVVDNLLDIEQIVHQFVLKGGVNPGTYKCIEGEDIWQLEDN